MGTSHDSTVPSLLTEPGGGLKHKNSTFLDGIRWLTRTRRLCVVSRWPPDFSLVALSASCPGSWAFATRTSPHESLWIAEGVTDYYGDLAAHRAGLATRDEFLDSLSAKIEELQTTPGRTVQSVELASFDAWIKYYRPDENSANTSISYYTKGAVAAFLSTPDRKVTAGPAVSTT